MSTSLIVMPGSIHTSSVTPGNIIRSALVYGNTFATTCPLELTATGPAIRGRPYFSISRKDFRIELSSPKILPRKISSSSTAKVSGGMRFASTPAETQLPDTVFISLLILSKNLIRSPILTAVHLSLFA